MNKETENYCLSVYETKQIIQKTSACRIELVVCSFDEQVYIKRTYHEDKRQIFHAMATIENPHIPKVKEVIFREDTTVIEQYVNGKSLHDLLKTQHLSKKQILALTSQLLTALDALHTRNIIHRDVKPDNIMIGKDGNLFLIDFGIARVYDSTLRQDTQQFGTMGYAPPEQFGFSQSDFRSDLYAAGVTIDEMGKAAGCSPKSAVMKVAAKCKEFDPNRRFQSANASLCYLRNQRILYKMAAILFSAILIFILIVPFLYESTDIQKNNASQLSPVSQTAEMETVSNEKMDASQSSESQPPSVSVTEEDDFDWCHIIDDETQDGFSFFPIPNGSEGTVQPFVNEDDILLDFELTGNTLVLSYENQNSQKQQFTFEHQPTLSPDYSDTQVDAELIVFDMDEDGQDEILVALSDRVFLHGVKGILLCHTNWRAVWCVGITPDDDFWLADGMVDTYTNAGSISIDLLGERELFVYDVREPVSAFKLKSHALQAIN